MIFKYLKTVLVHKRWVWRYCCKAHLYWQGIVHDLSKFSPTELIPSCKYFDGVQSPINIEKSEKGYSLVWLHHKGRNKHHYEYWQDNFDSGTTHLEMPYKYAVEMICDYLGAARTYWREGFSYVGEYIWWRNHKYGQCAMHPNTEAFVDTVLTYLRMSNDPDKYLKPEFLKDLYDTIHSQGGE